MTAASLRRPRGSILGAALLGGVNTLHTTFPDDADEEYLMQCELVLTRLGLDQILEQEVAEQRQIKVMRLQQQFQQKQHQQLSQRPHTQQQQQAQQPHDVISILQSQQCHRKRKLSHHQNHHQIIDHQKQQQRPMSSHPSNSIHDQMPSSSLSHHCKEYGAGNDEDEEYPEEEVRQSTPVKCSQSGCAQSRPHLDMSCIPDTCSDLTSDQVEGNCRLEVRPSNSRSRKNCVKLASYSRNKHGPSSLFAHLHKNQGEEENVGDDNLEEDELEESWKRSALMSILDLSAEGELASSEICATNVGCKHKFVLVKENTDNYDDKDCFLNEKIQKPDTALINKKSSHKTQKSVADIESHTNANIGSVIQHRIELLAGREKFREDLDLNPQLCTEKDKQRAGRLTYKQNAGKNCKNTKKLSSSTSESAIVGKSKREPVKNSSKKSSGKSNDNSSKGKKFPLLFEESENSAVSDDSDASFNIECSDLTISGVLSSKEKIEKKTKSDKGIVENFNFDLDGELSSSFKRAECSLDQSNPGKDTSTLYETSSTTIHSQRKKRKHTRLLSSSDEEFKEASTHLVSKKSKICEQKYGKKMSNMKEKFEMSASGKKNCEEKDTFSSKKGEGKPCGETRARSSKMNSSERSLSSLSHMSESPGSVNALTKSKLVSSKTLSKLQQFSFTERDAEVHQPTPPDDNHPHSISAKANHPFCNDSGKRTSNHPDAGDEKNGSEPQPESLPSLARSIRDKDQTEVENNSNRLHSGLSRETSVSLSSSPINESCSESKESPRIDVPSSFFSRVKFQQEKTFVEAPSRTPTIILQNSDCASKISSKSQTGTCDYSSQSSISRDEESSLKSILCTANNEAVIDTNRISSCNHASKIISEPVVESQVILEDDGSSQDLFPELSQSPIFNSERKEPVQQDTANPGHVNKFLKFIKPASFLSHIGVEKPSQVNQRNFESKNTSFHSKCKEHSLLRGSQNSSTSSHSHLNLRYSQTTSHGQNTNVVHKEESTVSHTQTIATSLTSQKNASQVLGTQEDTISSQVSLLSEFSHQSCPGSKKLKFTKLKIGNAFPKPSLLDNIKSNAEDLLRSQNSHGENSSKENAPISVPFIMSVGPSPTTAYDYDLSQQGVTKFNDGTGAEKNYLPLSTSIPTVNKTGESNSHSNSMNSASCKVTPPAWLSRLKENKLPSSSAASPWPGSQLSTSSVQDDELDVLLAVDL